MGSEQMQVRKRSASAKALRMSQSGAATTNSSPP
jgi:hypothetical protein